jgi:hypothetical protein
LGNKQGRIIKQSFALNGGILVKDSIVRWGNGNKQHRNDYR